MKTRQDIYNFMNRHGLGVLATIKEDGTPSAAIVGFGQTENFEILFGTDNTTRKYTNIQVNSTVAFTIGGDSPETVQLEGSARELLPDELDIVRKNYWRKNPHAESHSENPGERYFIIKPHWIRYTDLRVNPWDVTEIRL